MDFKIAGPIEQIETFATGKQIRELPRLVRIYGRVRWRERKGAAIVSLANGATRRAELHWYEASGLGRFEYKIKCYLD